MDDLDKWLLGTLSTFIVSSLGTLAFIRGKLMAHAERIQHLESVAVSKDEVRGIVMNEIAPIKESIQALKTATDENKEILTELRISTGILVKMAQERTKD